MQASPLIHFTSRDKKFVTAKFTPSGGGMKLLNRLVASGFSSVVKSLLSFVFPDGKVSLDTTINTDGEDLLDSLTVDSLHSIAVELEKIFAKEDMEDFITEVLAKTSYISDEGHQLPLSNPAYFDAAFGDDYLNIYVVFLRVIGVNKFIPFVDTLVERAGTLLK